MRWFLLGVLATLCAYAYPVLAYGAESPEGLKIAKDFNSACSQQPCRHVYTLSPDNHVVLKALEDAPATEEVLRLTFNNSGQLVADAGKWVNAAKPEAATMPDLQRLIAELEKVNLSHLVRDAQRAAQKASNDVAQGTRTVRQNVEEVADACRQMTQAFYHSWLDNQLGVSQQLDIKPSQLRDMCDEGYIANMLNVLETTAQRMAAAVR